MYGRVLDARGQPIAGAEVDVWLTDADGLYDLQAHGPDVVDLRARFRSDESGRYWFRSTRPRCYSIPMGGPVGDMVRATRQHGMRPAHVHYWVRAAGYRDLITALYFKDDDYLTTDAAFGVVSALVISVLPPAPDSPAPALPRIPYDFHLSRAAAGDTVA